MNKFISTVVLTSFCAFAFAANDKKIELGKYEGLKYSANDVPAAGGRLYAACHTGRGRRGHYQHLRLY